MKIKIAVIGLGYVGLPLAVEFSKKYLTVGYDLKKSRINQLNDGFDSTLEISKKELINAIKKRNFLVTNDERDFLDCNIFIVTVPTPVDKNNKPDLGFLISASRLVGKALKKDDIVIFESTVYPGATEEVCVPVLEQSSGLIFNKDFYCGYSPERINPGDKQHTINKIKKVTSESTPEISKQVDKLYKSIISAGTHLAPSIKVAEAAKVIENAQRDINIAFINELSMIFNKMGIDTNSVLEAAATKWNFLPFKPGLVGGHCIGVDPYYLAHKSKEIGYIPKLILAGRELNDSMGITIANRIITQLNSIFPKKNKKRVLILGLTFKENCPDTRNSKVADIISQLKSKGIEIKASDPYAAPSEVKKQFNVKLIQDYSKEKYHAILVAVAHNEYRDQGQSLRNLLVRNGFIFDIKGTLEHRFSDLRL